jgi:phosphotriesterase-related protein
LTEEQIADLWAGEYANGIGDTGVRPGFIKIALNGPVPSPEPVALKLLRAAILASKKTGMPIVSHTVWSEGALLAAQIMDEAGFDLERFIWAHADSNDCAEHQAALARRGMWISLDGIDSDYALQTGMLKSLAAACVASRALISQDSGWYNVGEPAGGRVRPYHTLFTEFIPYATAHGVEAALLEEIVTANAAKALRIRPVAR